MVPVYLWGIYIHNHIYIYIYSEGVRRESLTEVVDWVRATVWSNTLPADHACTGAQVPAGYHASVFKMIEVVIVQHACTRNGHNVGSLLGKYPLVRK